MSKQHFRVLDGMRGVAALSVAMLHASQIFGVSLGFDNASLAVDFFFCLSGFVVAYAYDNQLATAMSPGVFARKRLIRLYPMIICGLLIGFCVGTIRALSGGHHIAVFALTTASLVLFPLGLFLHNTAYPTDNPIWSLFFELVANGVYGLERGGKHTSRTAMALIIAASALALAAVAIVFGIQSVGFKTPATFPLGIVRVAFPFLMGVAIFRYGMTLTRLAVPDFVLAGVLLLVLCGPSVNPGWLRDLGAILLIFPMLIVLGLRASSSAPMLRLWSITGRLSYPFYAIHQPILLESV